MLISFYVLEFQCLKQLANQTVLRLLRASVHPRLTWRVYISKASTNGEEINFMFKNLFHDGDDVVRKMPYLVEYRILQKTRIQNSRYLFVDQVFVNRFSVYIDRMRTVYLGHTFDSGCSFLKAKQRILRTVLILSDENVYVPQIFTNVSSITVGNMKFSSFVQNLDFQTLMKIFILF